MLTWTRPGCEPGPPATLMNGARFPLVIMQVAGHAKEAHKQIALSIAAEAIDRMNMNVNTIAQ